MSPRDPDDSGMPRSLKVFLAVLGLLAAAFVALHLAGRGFHHHGL